MTRSLSLLALLLSLLCSLHARSDSPEEVLDNLQRAHAASDAAAFLAQLAPDAVVLGMGGSGALSGPALRSHIETLFAAGAAGDYHSVQRDVRYSAGGGAAWFNESLANPRGDQFWSSGTLVRTNAGWKVAQYGTAPVQHSRSTESAPAAQVTADSETPAGPATAEPVTQQECRRIRHKTNKVSSC